MNTLLMEVENGIAIVTINRPKAMNAINAEMLEEMNVLFQEISDRKDIKVVILTGAGGKAFVAGADISDMAKQTPAEARTMSLFARDIFMKLEKMQQVTIAAIDGFTFGGGCELSMCCDIRIASEKSKFGQPETGLGIIPGFGGTQRLARLVGMGRAKELIFTGDTIDAQEAYRIGLVNKVVPDSEIMDYVKKLAAKIASKAAYANAMAKQVIEIGYDMNLPDALALEANSFAVLFSTHDRTEGLTAFLEKRKPTFTDF